ncbi:MAG: tetratricopeptide repeat protein [Pseudomonadota bacterium]
MSVINHMLEDLDRRAVGREGGVALAGVRPVAQGRRRPVWLWIIVAAAAGAAGALAWQRGAERPATGTAAAPTAADTPAAHSDASPAGETGAPNPGWPPLSRQLDRQPNAPPTVAGVTSPSEAGAVRDPGPAESPAPPRSPPLTGDSAEYGVTDRPAAAAPAAVPGVVASAPGPAAKTRSRVAQPAPAAARQPEPARAAAPVAEAPADDSRIDKTVRQPTPQEQAENEFRRALALMREHRDGEAIDALGRALRLEPRHETARQTQVALLLQQNRVADAEAALRQGLEVNPGQPGFVMALARIQVERGDNAGALATLGAAAPAAAGMAQFQAFMAALLQRERRHEEAVARYRNALALSPGNGVWLMGLGISLEAGGAADDARRAFEGAKASNQLQPELVAFVDQRLAGLGRRR